MVKIEAAKAKKSCFLVCSRGQDDIIRVTLLNFGKPQELFSRAECV